MTGQRSAEHDVLGPAHWKRRPFAQAFGDPPATQMLQGPDVDGLASGTGTGHRHPGFDHEAVDAAPSQLDGCGQAHGPPAGDQDLRGGGRDTSHASSTFSLRPSPSVARRCLGDG